MRNSQLKLSEKFKRKILINIYFLIKYFLKSQGKRHYKKIELNLSPETLKFYRKWFKFYIKYASEFDK